MAAVLSMTSVPFEVAVRPVTVSARPRRSKVAVSAEKASGAKIRPPAPAPCGMTSSAPRASVPRRTMTAAPRWVKLDAPPTARVSVPEPFLIRLKPWPPAPVRLPWIRVSPAPSTVQAPLSVSWAARRPPAKVTVWPATFWRKVTSVTSPPRSTTLVKVKACAPASACVALFRNVTAPPNVRVPPTASIVASPKRMPTVSAASAEARRSVPPRTSSPPAYVPVPARVSAPLPVFVRIPAPPIAPPREPAETARRPPESVVAPA